MLIVFFCICSGLYAGAKPVIKLKNNGGKDRQPENVAAYNAVNLSPPPTLTYSTPLVYITTDAITPLAPTSTGVGAPAYNSTILPIGAGCHR